MTAAEYREPFHRPPQIAPDHEAVPKPIREEAVRGRSYRRNELGRASKAVTLTLQGGIMSASDLRKVPKVERSGKITIVTFTQDAIRDVENVLARELEGLTGGTGKRHLLLDFTNVERLNSIELGTLVTLHKQMQQTDGRLTLFNISVLMFRLFSVTRLDTLLHICRRDMVDGLPGAAGAQASDPE